MTSGRRVFLGFALAAAMLLGFGVVTTIAVAWIPSAVPSLRDLRREDRGLLDEPYWAVGFLEQGRAVRVCEYRLVQRRQEGTSPTDPWANVAHLQNMQAELVIRNSRPLCDAPNEITGLADIFASMPRTVAWTPEAVTLIVAGWPRPCVRGALVRPALNTVAGGQGVGLVGWEWEQDLDNVRGLPVLILWPGLAADTAFYAGAWFIIMFAPRQARRELRRRRGACVGCGYDLAGLGDGAGCPECGCGREVKGAQRK